METGKLIFITGGARSGKSSFAEAYAASEAETTSGSLHYIATSKPSDAEMVEKIKRHQSDREESDVAWKTWEWPVDLHKVVPHFKQSDVVLLDCLTVLLSNELFRYEHSNEENIFDTILDGIFSIEKSIDALIIVSNEVLTEAILDETVVRSYAKILGNLHQVLVKHADEAYLAEAGIPILMKERSLR